ncbi:MAG: DUF1616 domain-containing protein [Nitrososphaerota archaeon]
MTKKLRNENSDVEKRILRLIEKEKPESISSLLKIMKERLSLKEDEALKHVIQLVNEGKIRLREQPKLPPESLKAYMHSNDAYWFWITVSLAAATVITVFTIPENAYPIVYMRYVLGSIFVLWLPGYALIKMLFPSRKDLDSIERIALSIGLSLALVPLVGLLLNYTPWGIRLTPITLSLLALTLIFAVTALIREYQLQTRA